MNLIEAKKIKKSFGRLEVLKGISLQVSEGQVVSIIGPSGSGKSTLLRCLTQLETADQGEITVCGEKMMWTESGRAVYANKNTLHNIILNVGLVFQNFNLFPHFSVLENLIDAPIRIRGVSREEATQRARELLRKMDLASKENSYPCELSGGQQQRVAIARALAMQPRILFFDEPTSALKVIRELAQEHMTMVIVTHEMAFARDVADHVIFMADGVIIEEGTPQQVFENTQNARTQAFLSRFSQNP